ncbi:hypothetical protein DFJ73DRAFT_852066 [Zopfochytrium polystomum]|nr:hypothetical protein DFJ73DRAFT_852066 [Zopfochytrium polystomum]
MDGSGPRPSSESAARPSLSTRSSSRNLRLADVFTRSSRTRNATASSQSPNMIPRPATSADFFPDRFSSDGVRLAGDSTDTEATHYAAVSLDMPPGAYAGRVYGLWQSGDDGFAPDDPPGAAGGSFAGRPNGNGFIRGFENFKESLKGKGLFRSVSMKDPSRGAKAPALRSRPSISSIRSLNMALDSDRPPAIGTEKYGYNSNDIPTVPPFANLHRKPSFTGHMLKSPVHHDGVESLYTPSSANPFMVSRAMELHDDALATKVFSVHGTGGSSQFTRKNSLRDATTASASSLGRSNSFNAHVSAATPHSHRHAHQFASSTASSRSRREVVSPVVGLASHSTPDSDDDGSVDDEEDSASIWRRHGIDPAFAAPGSAADVSSIASGISGASRRTPANGAHRHHPFPPSPPSSQARTQLHNKLSVQLSQIRDDAASMTSSIATAGGNGQDRTTSLVSTRTASNSSALSSPLSSVVGVASGLHFSG